MATPRRSGFDDDLDDLITTCFDGRMPSNSWITHGSDGHVPSISRFPSMNFDLQASSSMSPGVSHDTSKSSHQPSAGSSSSSSNSSSSNSSSSSNNNNNNNNNQKKHGQQQQQQQQPKPSLVSEPSTYNELVLGTRDFDTRVDIYIRSGQIKNDICKKTESHNNNIQSKNKFNKKNKNNKNNKTTSYIYEWKNDKRCSAEICDNGKKCQQTGTNKWTHCIQRKKSQPTDCKYCTERKEGIKSKGDKKNSKSEWRKGVKVKVAGGGSEGWHTGQITVSDFSKRYCKIRHDSLGALLLYCQKRARSVGLEDGPPSLRLNPLLIEQHQDTLVSFGFKVNYYIQWSRGWGVQIAHRSKSRSPTSTKTSTTSSKIIEKSSKATEEEYNKVDQYIRDFFQVGSAQDVQITLKDIKQLATDLDLGPEIKAEINKLDSNQFRKSFTAKVPCRLKAQWEALKLANILREFGHLEHANICIQIALNGFASGGQSATFLDDTPEKYLLDKTRAMQISIVKVQLRRENKSKEKKPRYLKGLLELELKQLFETQISSLVNIAAKLTAEYQKCEFDFDKATAATEDKQAMQAILSTMKDIEIKFEIEYQDQSLNSFSSSSSSVQTPQHRLLVRLHHIKLSVILASFRCGDKDWQETLDALLEEKDFRLKTYHNGEQNRH
jgi:hypothetical protein